MAIYEKKFTKPYAGGYKDKPDKTTPVTADILNMEDDTLVAIEDYLANLETESLDDVTIKNSLIVGSKLGGDDPNGTHSMINGSYCLATGNDSHAEGLHTTASGQASHSEGINTVSSGVMSHAEGYETKASGTYQHVQGKYNVEDTENKYAHIVGGGTSDTDRKNILTLDWNGNVEFAGDVRTGNGASLDELNEQSGSMAENISAMQTELTSQGKAIVELADKKITKFYASSQGDTTLSDSDNGKMQDMMLYGKSEQKQYSGKNLLNTLAYPFKKKTAIDTEKGSIYETSTDTWSAISDYIPFEHSNNFYALSESLTAYFYANDYSYLRVTEKGKIPEGTMYVRFDCKTVNVEKAQFEFGSEPTDYEPYVGGIPSPNPDYPQEIKSVVEPVVKVTGKNLLKPTLQTTTKNGVTCTNNGDGTYTLNGTATENAEFAVYNEENPSILNRGKTYRLTGCPSGANGGKNFYMIFNYWDVPPVYDVGNGTKKTFTAEKQGIRIDIGVSSGATVSNVVFKPMLVDYDLYPSTTYDDFEPYKGYQSVPLTGITLNAIPVSSGGNVTIYGQQYISDYVDVERGKIVRRVTRFVFDGSSDEAWSLVKGTNNFFSIVPEKVLKYHSEMLCNVAIVANITPVTVNTSTIGITVVAKNAFRYRYEINNDLTLNDLFERLSSIPMVVYAELETPTEESISDELAEKLKALQTYYPQTNLFITSNQLDGYAIFNYPISLANGWNYVKQQIGDTRDYIYDMDLQMAQAYVNSEYAVALTELEV